MIDSAMRARLVYLLATTALATPAAAQLDPNLPPAPTRPAIDANGVDIIQGTFNLATTDLRIGSDDSKGMTYSRYWTGSGWRDNLIATITISGNVYTVSFGNISDRFTWNGSVFTGTEGQGSTLMGDSAQATYKSPTGTIVYFNKYPNETDPYQINLLRVRSMTYPTGEKLTYVYHSAEVCPYTYYPQCGQPVDPYYKKRTRLQSVVSNFGYQLKFEYQYNQEPYSITELLGGWLTLIKITVFNMAVDTCSESAISCTFTQTWPNVVITGANAGGAVRELTVTDALSRTTRYTMDSYGQRMIGVKRPGSAVDDLTIGYDGSNRVSSITSGSLAWLYSYVDSGNIRTTTVADPLGHQQVVESDPSLQRVVADQDELGRETAYQYDAMDRISRITGPGGNYAQYTYDTRGNVTQVRAVAKPGSGLADIVTSASYPATCVNVVTCNLPASATDPRGNVTDYAYDATHGGLVTQTLPPPSVGATRPQMRYSYTALQAYYKNYAGTIVASGQPVYQLTAISACATGATCAGAAAEVKTTLAYGATGVANNLLLTGASTGAGNGSLTATGAMTYDGVGNLLTADGPLAGTADTSRVRYDAVRQPVGSVSPDPDGAGPLKPRARRFTYNLDGQVTKVENGNVNSQSDADWAAMTVSETANISYDTDGRKTKQTLSSGGTTYAATQFGYDGEGRLECIAQRMNPAEFSSLPASACSLDSAGSFGPDRITKTIYDAADQVTQVRSAVGTTDEANEVASTYSPTSRLATITDAEGNRTTYEYDGHDRLAKTRFPSPTVNGTSSTTDYEQLTYDPGSNVTNLRLRDGQNIAITLDNLSRPTIKNLPGSELDVTYTYDNLDRMTGASQTGNALSFTYDALGRNLTQAGPHGTVTSAYDIAGRRTRLTYPGTGLYIDQDYLVTGETTKIRENGATIGVGVLATFGYDNLGRRTTLTRGNGTSAAYGLDPVSRLSSLIENLAGTSHDQSLGFAYNPASQITTNTRSNDLYVWNGHGSGTTASSVNGLNQLTLHGGTALTHDARGNMTSDGSRTFSYSFENLLTAASGGVTLGYDPMLRLYQVAGASTTRFAYDGIDLIAEFSGANALQRRFVHGPGMDEPLVWYEGASTTDRRFLHADERGSIVAVSNSSGTMLNINAYDEYGVPKIGNVGRFQYTGQAWLPEVGLYYYKARFYHPRLGRFVQTDPIGYGAGMNLYAYVGADPVNLADPLGLDDEHIIVTGTRLKQNSQRDLPRQHKWGSDQSWQPHPNQGRDTAAPEPFSSGRGRSCDNAIKNAATTASIGGIEYDTPLELKALRDWHVGRTFAMRLPQPYLDRVTRFYAQYPNQSSDLLSKRGDPPGSFRKTVTFANYQNSSINDPVLDGLLGQATVLFNQNNQALGLLDTFDFNSGNRGWAIELGMADIRAGAGLFCGNQAGFRISAGVLQ